jgi:hypothetical protein
MMKNGNWSLGLVLFFLALFFAARLLGDGADTNGIPAANPDLIETNGTWFVTAPSNYPFAWSDLVCTNALITIESILAPVNSFVIGPVSICTTNGAVTIEDGISMDEASREFWRILSDTYPGCFPAAFATNAAVNSAGRTE